MDMDMDMDSWWIPSAVSSRKAILCLEVTLKLCAKAMMICCIAQICTYIITFDFTILKWSFKVWSWTSICQSGNLAWMQSKRELQTYREVLLCLIALTENSKFRKTYISFFRDGENWVAINLARWRKDACSLGKRSTYICSSVRYTCRRDYVSLKRVCSQRPRPLRGTWRATIHLFAESDSHCLAKKLRASANI